MTGANSKVLEPLQIRIKDLLKADSSSEYNHFEICGRGCLGIDSAMLSDTKTYTLKEFTNKKVKAIACGDYHTLVLAGNDN